MSKLIDWIRRWQNSGRLPCFDSIVLATSRHNRQGRLGAIFCLHGLGDLLLAGHAISHLARHMRSTGLKVILFVEEDLVQFARQYLDADQVEGIDRGRFVTHLAYRIRILRAMALLGRFDMAVQPTFNRTLRVEDCLVRATRARRRIGAVGTALFNSAIDRWWGDRCYTRLVCQDSRDMHELERYSEFMAGMGIGVEPRVWRISPKVGPVGRPYVAVCPSSSIPLRTWPLSNFLQVAYRISAPRGWDVVVVGPEAGDQPLPWPAGGPRLTDSRGQLAAEALPAVLAAAQLVLCNDSGPYHLGISLGRPTVAVGGGGLPVRYYPYPQDTGGLSTVVFRPVPCGGCGWRCIHPVSRTQPAWCVQQVDWTQVALATEHLLRWTG